MDPAIGEVFSWHDHGGEQHYSDKPKGAKQPSLSTINQPRLYRISAVYDGDTVTLDRKIRVRLLGVNTPELQQRGRGAEPFGETAAKWLRKKLLNRSVRVIYDVERKDRYGRHLAHLFTAQGEHINLSLVAQGLAFVSTVPPNTLHLESLLNAEKEAITRKLGLWAHPRYQAKEVGRFVESLHGKGWYRLTGKVQSLAMFSWGTELTLHSKLKVRLLKKHNQPLPNYESYLGKPIEVRGWLSVKSGYYSIRVRHPSRILLPDY